jgi:hypothetical protein
MPLSERTGVVAGMRFFLGVPEPAWLARTNVPLFLSRRGLARRKRLPRACGAWALDSGGFSELNAAGCWSITACQYAAEVRRWANEIGRLEWAAVMDWMCEPFVLAKTGLSVREHQRRTVDSYRDLRNLAPELPWVPVLQGWTLDDYRRHADDYARAGIDLTTLPLVGVGSICRRQHTREAAGIVRQLWLDDIRIHGFGLKLQGLRAVGALLESADSMAWSFQARREKLNFCGAVGHRNCANCLPWALAWRERVIAMKFAPTIVQRQLPLFAERAS